MAGIDGRDPGLEAIVDEVVSEAHANRALLLPESMVAMNAPERTLAPLLATIHPHPTLSEAVKIAARDG